ncbi:hypothetical protein KAFR_0B00810 [Kazachstania africana CBS 2517]|uniref:Uncharacterized protein n=1 Tax=Kazachstania africana (strain ATCC 22294 / BCRC 22015 / CBS 2517 / CECT 1963 / NBRC 1671 / NRRL Y-8276) TaxID=1071382 RepID=H2APS9_KAZAF|nr:hypothetical protein KAFR_0B00810 [Kazachstania africana CBS 2517]CCF56379.1 hypothetical protein KAFR_0B00810 [Kazachstania africana CBS 2517]
MDDTTQKYKVSTGRGGIGNFQKSGTRVSPKLVPQGSQTPALIQPVYSTGRGGVGNMRKNVDPKLTRIAQDVDADDIILVKTNTSHEIRRERTIEEVTDKPPTVAIGRGGAGNIVSPETSITDSNKKKPNKRHTSRKKHEKKGFWSSLRNVFA